MWKVTCCITGKKASLALEFFQPYKRNRTKENKQTKHTHTHAPNEQNKKGTNMLPTEKKEQAKIRRN